MIDNGVLLCPKHHHLLHSSAYQLRLIDGRPWILAPPWLDQGSAGNPSESREYSWQREKCMGAPATRRPGECFRGCQQEQRVADQRREVWPGDVARGRRSPMTGETSIVASTPVFDVGCQQKPGCRGGLVRQPIQT